MTKASTKLAGTNCLIRPDGRRRHGSDLTALWGGRKATHVAALIEA